MRDPPANSIIVDKKKLACLGHEDFKTNGSQVFNPEQASAPFEIWDEGFLDILGDNPQLELLIESLDYAFAWEAPIWIEETDEVFFASMGGQPHRSKSDLSRNNKIFRICLKELAPGTSQESAVTEVIFYETPLDAPERRGLKFLQQLEIDSPHVQMTNGGTNYRDKLLFANEGRGQFPGTLALIDRKPPYKVDCLLNNLYGRRFNSPNDLCVHPKSGAIFFTDPTYGFNQDFCPSPSIPNQVYCFYPETGHIRVVANGIAMPNGIVFSPDGRTCYITDTSAIDARGAFDGTKGATIYAYDVIGHGKTHNLVNKRIFAWVDTGVPDGIKSDENGNIYSGCGDGVHVWNPEGVLLGKIKAPVGGIGNLVFCGKGRLVFHSGERFYLARIAAGGLPLGTYGPVEMCS